MNKSPRKPWLRAVTVVLATLGLCFIILEVGLRALGRMPSNMADGIYAQDGDSFRLKADSIKTINFPAFSYKVYTDEYGFRAQATGPRPLVDQKFITFLGASDVFGNGVDYKDSFVGIVSERARQQGLEVLNLAVGGHYFLDQEDLLDRFIQTTRRTPSLVAFCVNELHIPKFDKRNTNILVKSGYVFNRSTWRAAYVRLMVGNLSSAYCFFRDAFRKIQEKWLHYELNEKSPEFLRIYSRTSRMHDSQEVKAFEDSLDVFGRYCSDKGLTLVYVYIPISDSYRLDKILRQIGEDPADYDTSYYEKMMQTYCEKRGLPLYDLRPILQRAFDDGNELRFRLDPHYNAFGNRVIGDYLAHAMF
jgi:hypothetical protein